MNNPSMLKLTEWTTLERFRRIENALGGIADALAVDETVVIEPGTVKAKQITDALKSERE